MTETNNNINSLLNYTDSTSVPPECMSYKHALLNNSTKIFNLEGDTGANGYDNQVQDNIILKNPQSTTTGTQVRLPDNSIIHQNFMEIYLSQCYHHNPHKTMNIQT